MYVSGEIPGIGTYICMKCHFKLVIKSINEKLPECPNCKTGIFKKVD